MHFLIEDFEDNCPAKPTPVSSIELMCKLVGHLRGYLERDLRLVCDWARRPFQSHAPRVPVFHSQELVSRLNLPDDLKSILMDRMFEWPLRDFFEKAEMQLACGKANACSRNTMRPESSSDPVSILLKSPDDQYLKDFLNQVQWVTPRHSLRDFTKFKDCVVNDDWHNIEEFQRAWRSQYCRISVNTLTVTLCRFCKQRPPLHDCNVCLPMVHPSVLGFGERDDWDKLLVFIAKLWQEKLTQSREFSSFEAEHGDISWDVVHHKRTIFEVDGNPFVLARCNSDRLAVVARWKDNRTGEQIEIVHMYFAMGLPNQHPKQFIVLAVCKGLFIAAALVEAMHEWWPETVVLPSTGQEEANTELLRQWQLLVPERQPQASLAASRDKWEEISKALTGLKSRSEITAEKVSKVLAL